MSIPLRYSKRKLIEQVSGFYGPEIVQYAWNILNKIVILNEKQSYIINKFRVPKGNNKKLVILFCLLQHVQLHTFTILNYSKKIEFSVENIIYQFILSTGYNGSYLRFKALDFLNKYSNNTFCIRELLRHVKIPIQQDNIVQLVQKVLDIVSTF